MFVRCNCPPPVICHWSRNRSINSHRSGAAWKKCWIYRKLRNRIFPLENVQVNILVSFFTLCFLDKEYWIYPCALSLYKNHLDMPIAVLIWKLVSCNRGVCRFRVLMVKYQWKLSRKENRSKWNYGASFGGWNAKRYKQTCLNFHHFLNENLPRIQNRFRTSYLYLLHLKHIWSTTETQRMFQHHSLWYTTCCPKLIACFGRHWIWHREWNFIYVFLRRNYAPSIRTFTCVR